MNLRAARVALVLAVGLIVCMQNVPANAQSNPLFVNFGPPAFSVAKGALYKPDTGPAPHVAVIVIHRTANFLSHPACTELSARGFMVLCMNSSFDNNETLVDFEPIALDIKRAITFLRKQPGITKIILFGHSGGGSTVAFYQAVAESGVSYCQNPDRLTKCDNSLAGLPKADGLILADAHPGEPEQLMRGMNPSYVYNEKTGKTTIIADLDPFDPKNGYNPNGASNYSADFQTRYFAAQAKEMDYWITRAQAGLSRKPGLFTDDGVMVIRGAGNPGPGDSGRALLFVLDPNIAAIGTSLEPHKLLKNDGTIVTEIIRSVKAPNQVASGKTNPVAANRSFDSGAKIYTYRAFLSTDAMRATNSLNGIDYCSSNDSAACALPVISAPLLIETMGANDFVRDNEKMFDSAHSKDKDYIVIEGALHTFDPCVPCETTPGEYSNSKKNLFDYTAAWINKRF
jgi:hypothetical protein